MKKNILILILAALAAVSCYRGDYVGGSDPIVGGHSSEGNYKLRTYMMSIADNLIAGILDEFELATSINGKNMSRSSHFDISGALNEVGSVWTVRADDSKFKGLSIRCDDADGKWTVSFKGNFPLVKNENFFPTNIVVTVKKHETTSEKSTGWETTISGSREERGGYTCTFESESLTYVNTRGIGTQGWDQMFGDLYMEVFKSSDSIDYCCLTFNGSPGKSTLIRGL